MNAAVRRPVSVLGLTAVRRNRRSGMRARTSSARCNRGGLIVGWLVATAVISYFIGVRITGRRYYARRHGLSFERNGLSSNVAGLLAMLWPVTLLIPQVRAPELCSHHTHVVTRERLLQQLEAEQALIEQNRRRRSGQ